MFSDKVIMYGELVPIYFLSAFETFRLTITDNFEFLIFNELIISRKSGR
jgi:hypothetical protein